MANETAKIIPIRRGAFLTGDEQEIVELAFALWLGRFGERNGSPIDDFLNAWQEVRTRTAGPRKRAAKVILVNRAPSSRAYRTAGVPPSAG